MKKFSRELKILLVLLLPIIAVAVMHHFVTGFTIYNDGIGYYSYLRSFAIDHDVDFLNEWRWYNQSYSKFSDVPRGVNFPETRTQIGKIDNLYLIGSSIMWGPFFYAVHLPTQLLHAIGLGGPADGYGLQYEFAIGAANIFYGFLGIVIMYKLLRKWFRKKTALLSTVAVWYGTSAFWYHGIEPSMAHMNSVFLTSLFVYAWHATLGKRKAWQWIALGAILGMIFLVRQQEILLGALIGFELLKRALEKFGIARIRETVSRGALVGAGIFAVLIPQMLAWKALKGSYIVYSYSETASQWYWTVPQVIPVLLNAEMGIWKIPALVLGIIGIFIFAKRKGGVAWYFAAILLAEFLVTAAWSGWYAGYGLRFLLGVSAFIALGFAEITERIENKFGARAAYIMVAAVIAANFLNMLGFLLGEVGSRMPVTEIPGLIIGRLL